MNLKNEIRLTSRRSKPSASKTGKSRKRSRFGGKTANGELVGVKLGASEEIGAHAWLDTPHAIPVGGDEAAQFAPLKTVDPNA